MRSMNFLNSFQERTTIYFEKFTDGKEMNMFEKNGSEIYEFDNIVVLVNENTASASEVFALAKRKFRCYYCR